MKLSTVAQILKKANVIALAAHINPDGDALGSVLGLGMALKKLGKQVHMYIDDDIPEQFAFLPNIKEIKRPAAEGELNADLLVILDVSDCERLGNVRRYIKAPCVMNIDHHISNNGLADIVFLDVAAAATCELVCRLIEALGVELEREMASVLYVGIVTDCGFFRYANTTPSTLVLAAKLLATGINSGEIADILETQSAEYLLNLPKILETLEFYEGGRIASISIPVAMYNEAMDSDALVKYPRYVEGVEVAVLFKGVAAGRTRVSIRSRMMDISKVAMEYGGGGHIRAAGCTVEGDITMAKDLIIAAITRHLGATV